MGRWLNSVGNLEVNGKCTCISKALFQSTDFSKHFNNTCRINHSHTRGTHISCSSGALRGSASCSRTLQHAAKPSYYQTTLSTSWATAAPQAGWHVVGYLLYSERLIPVWQMDSFTPLSNHLSSLAKMLTLLSSKEWFSPSDVSGQQSLGLRSWPSCVVPFFYGRVQLLLLGF